jgi:hypothetical protein
MKKTSVLSICVLTIFAGSLLLTHHIQRPDNGDGWRVLRSAHILSLQDNPAHQPFPRFYDFRAIGDIDYRALIPMSSSAAIVELVSLVQRAAQFKHFDFLGSPLYTPQSISWGFCCFS